MEPGKFMVSVIIPTYNRRESLTRALASVLEQSFRDWEVLVVDDGSEDGSRQAIRRLRDSRIRYVHQENQGVSSARNTGIRLSRFPWISFLDSDDYWKPAKLERQLEALRHRRQYRVIYSDEIWIRRGRRVNPKKIHRKYSGWIYHRCLPLCIISPSSVLMHRQVFEEQGLFDEAFPVCEDYELWLRIASRHPLLFLREALIVKTGGHPDQLSRSLWGMDRSRVQSLIKTYRSNRLTPQQRVWTAREIVTKATILARGFQNRGKQPEALQYDNLRCEWQKRTVEGGWV